jgi:hypothetical protein
MQLKRSESGMIALGGFLFLASFYLFMFDTDRVFKWIGLDRYEKRPKIAEVEVIRNMVRRKEFEMPEFRNVQVRQDVRVKDSVMTGSDSVAVLHFIDGSVVELVADSLVQLDTTGSPDALGNFQLLLDVKKGEVRTAGPMKNLRVTRDQKTIEVKPVSKDSEGARVAAAIAESKPIERATDCEAPTVDRKGNEMDIRMLCPGFIAERNVRIFDSTGALVATKTISIAPNLPGKIGWAPVKPGAYTVEVDQAQPVKTSIVVPERVRKLSWAPDPIRCGRSLAYVPSGSASAVTLEGEDGKVLMSLAPGSGIIEPGEAVPAPVKLKVVESFADGFKWETAMLDVAKWRQCPILTYPADGGSEKVHSVLGTMFTWTSLGSQDHFQFELAEDPLFTRIILTQESRMNLIRIRPTVRGPVYWRVKDVQTGELSNFSKVVLR